MIRARPAMSVGAGAVVGVAVFVVAAARYDVGGHESKRGLCATLQYIHSTCIYSGVIKKKLRGIREIKANKTERLE